MSSQPAVATADVARRAPSVMPVMGNTASGLAQNQTASVTSNQDASTPALPVDMVAQWEMDRTDAQTRAVQLDALGSMPRTYAINTLQRVLVAGQSEDRQVALQVLRTMTLQQGDADGRIRTALREVIDHEDDTIAQDSQSALDDIEFLANSNGLNAAH